MTDIWQYLDYRKYLKDVYTEKKKLNPHFSYRYIGEKAGFSSAGFFTKILQGRSNISTRLVFALADLLKLGKREAQYFESLVLFNQAKTHTEKSRYFERLKSLRQTKATRLQGDQFLLFDKWYYVTIRELLDFYPFKSDTGALAKMLVPRIKPWEAEDAIRTLEKIRLIKRDSDGRYRRVDSIISTGDDYASVVVKNYQISLMELSREVFDRFPKEQRDISTLTLSVSESNFRTMTEMLAKTRSKLLELAKNDDHADRVYQLNVQLFPVSARYEGGKS